jgi:Peptidase M50B-like
VWFLLFGGLRPVVELARGSWGSAGGSRSSGRRQRWTRGSDAEQLARLTGAPAGLWISLFVLVALAALIAGVALLAPPGAPLGSLHP